MRSSLFLTWFWGVLVIQCALAEILISNDCDAELKRMIRDSIEEVEEMLGNAIDRLQNVAQSIRAKHGTWSDLTGGAASARRTWEKIAFVGPGMSVQLRNPGQRERMLQGLDETMRNMTTMRSNLAQLQRIQGKGVQITCGTSWLEEQASQPDVYRDLRNTVAQDSERGLYYIQGGLDAFKAERAAMLLLSNTAGPYTTVIALNGGNKQLWKRKATRVNVDNTSFRAIKGLAIRVLTDHTVNLEDLVAHSLTADLLWAFRRLGWETTGTVASERSSNRQESPKDSASDPLMCTPGGSWKCVRESAGINLWRAELSPLNFMYLVVALWVQPWDWSTGSNQIPSGARLDTRDRPARKYLPPNPYTAETESKKRPAPSDGESSSEQRRPSIAKTRLSSDVTLLGSAKTGASSSQTSKPRTGEMFPNRGPLRFREDHARNWQGGPYPPVPNPPNAVQKAKPTTQQQEQQSLPKPVSAEDPHPPPGLPPDASTNRVLQPFSSLTGGPNLPPLNGDFIRPLHAPLQPSPNAPADSISHPFDPPAPPGVQRPPPGLYHRPGSRLSPLAPGDMSWLPTARKRPHGDQGGNQGGNQGPS